MKLKKIRSERYIRADILKMALEIQKYNQDNLTFIGILKGGMYTMYSLLKLFSSEKNDVIIGHVGLSSYNKEMVSSEKIRVTYPLDLDKKDIKGRDVWIIDDIIDTGLTLFAATQIVRLYKPKSIHIAVLVDKRKKRIKQNVSVYGEADVVGYTYEGEEFLVGCGMGIGEEYRHLNFLYKIEEGEE